jgi:hypothetical protein
MKVYTTKYALSAGIQVHEVEPPMSDDNYVYTAGSHPQGVYSQQFIMGKTAFHTYEEAAVAAREMRNKKIESVRKQLNRLSGLLFPTKEPENLK